MDKIDFFKYLSLFLVIILTTNIVLFAIRAISAAIFWILLIIVGIFAYKLLPLIRKNK